MPTRPAGTVSREFHRLDEIALRAGGLLASRIGARRLLGLELERAWSDAVGSRVRAVTRLSRFRDGILEVDVCDAAWQRALRRLEGKILPRLAERLPARHVERIRFQVRPALFHEAASMGPSGGEASLMNTTAPQAVPQPPLSDRLRRVMGRYLERSAACRSAGG